MSRSGYDDDYDGDFNALNLYRANVDRSLAGKRGQAFLKEMLAAMDALPDKKLAAGIMQEQGGEVCAIGSVGKARGLDMSNLDRIIENEDYERLASAIAKQFGIAECMAREIMYMNDDRGPRDESPEQRFTAMRKWVESNIKREAE